MTAVLSQNLKTRKIVPANNFASMNYRIGDNASCRARAFSEKGLQMGYRRRTKAVVIAEKLSEEIKAGKYDVDGKLPSVRAQMKRFGVSDKTVCHAYCMLENAGYVQRVVGFGTVAAQQRVGA